MIDEEFFGFSDDLFDDEDEIAEEVLADCIFDETDDEDDI